jgi:cytoskeletal protein RodZ
MTTKAKAITWIIVAVVVIGGGVWWWVSMSQTATAPTTSQTLQPTSTAQTAMMTPTSTPTSTPSNGVSATDDSNAALQGDLSNIDTQMNGFSSDNASVTQGMNDQQGQESQL